jgi:hypothetical protein
MNGDKKMSIEGKERDIYIHDICMYIYPQRSKVNGILRAFIYQVHVVMIETRE